MALTGHLSDLSLSELIEFFCNQRKTGQLKVLYPQGNGYFYLQTGSVVDARIGVLRGIDAVYYALTLPNAKFEFSGATDLSERTINQPWTQVVLEGLRRLDEGVVPTAAFPAGYSEEENEPEVAAVESSSFTDLENLRVPGFLSFISAEPSGSRSLMIAGAVSLAVIASIAAIGVPAGWYNRANTVVVSQPSKEPVNADPSASSSIDEASSDTSGQLSESADVSDQNNDAALAAKRQRERDKKAREEKAAAMNQASASSSLPMPSNPAVESTKPGPKKVSVTVTYDESGRVTQASGSDATAVRIARQKRFPAGKGGSTTITIPIN
jgi:uncharacterized protein DUF4388